MTVYDIQHLAMPELLAGLHKRLYARAMFALVRRRAASVLSISQFTTDELVGRLGMHPDQVTTTPLGVDSSWFEVVKLACPHPRPFVLFVGNFKPHKNIRRLLEAFGALANRIPHDLVLIGKHEGFITGDQSALAQARKLGERVRLAGEVSDEELKQFLAHSDALVQPSLYEGFGLPPLEAMACGCPVLAARAGSLPEVCGDAAIYCDPRDVGDIARQLERLVTDGALRAELRGKGRTRARAYTWDDCAARTAAVIGAFLPGRPVSL